MILFAQNALPVLCYIQLFLYHFQWCINMYQGHNKTQETDFTVQPTHASMSLQEPYRNCYQSGYRSQKTKNGCDFKALGVIFALACELNMPATYCLPQTWI